MGKTTTVIWDWNGTLLDDAPVCVAAINDMLRERSLPQLSAERYQEIFCFPVSEYYRKAGFDFSKEPFERLAVLYQMCIRDSSSTARRGCGMRRT